MDCVFRLKTLLKAELAEHIPYGLLSIPLNEMHVSLHIYERILLNKTVYKLNTSVVSSYLGLEV